MTTSAQDAAARSAVIPSDDAGEHWITLWVRETVTLMVPRPQEAKVQGAMVGALRDTLLIEVRPGEENVGTLLGRQGETINALRHVVKRFGQRERLYVDIKVLTAREGHR